LLAISKRWQQVLPTRVGRNLKNNLTDTFAVGDIPKKLKYALYGRFLAISILREMPMKKIKKEVY
jgi:hypothetical protein